MLRKQELAAVMSGVDNQCHIEELPEELKVMILSYVDIKSQVSGCRLVCKSWKEIVDTESLRNQAISMKLIPRIYPKQPWYLYSSLPQYGKNLLRNPCGKDNLNNWNIVQSGGSGWGIEHPPVGCSLVIPEEAVVPAGSADSGDITCFVTSFSVCQKEQIIRLRDYCIPDILMDNINPEIEISEWYAPRFDCASQYSILVELLDINAKLVGEAFLFNATMEQWTEAIWKQVKHVFKDYGPGVRFIRFCHQGEDAQFWRGHYGSKMTLATVKLKPLC